MDLYDFEERWRRGTLRACDGPELIEYTRNLVGRLGRAESQCSILASSFRELQESLWELRDYTQKQKAVRRKRSDACLKVFRNRDATAEELVNALEAYRLMFEKDLGAKKLQVVSMNSRKRKG
jgi:hypothetical protein